MRIGLTFVLLLSLLVGLSSAATSSPTTLNIATGEYPPFTDSGAPDGGFVNASVTELARLAGYNVSFRYLPWKRALALTQQARFHATSYFAHSTERDEHFIHVGPIVRSAIVLFRRADAEPVEWSRLEDLSHLRFGAVPGYTYNAEFWRLSENGTLNVELAQSDEANLRKLRAGRIDVFISNKRSGYEMIERVFGKAGREDFTTLAKPLVMTNGYLLVPRAVANAEKLASELQAAADTLITLEQM